MLTFHYPMTRRTFLKNGAILSAMTVGFKRKKAFAAPPNSLNQAGYGVGAYSNGDYPGYAIYLPLISKEND